MSILGIYLCYIKISTCFNEFAFSVCLEKYLKNLNCPFLNFVTYENFGKTRLCTCVLAY